MEMRNAGVAAAVLSLMGSGAWGGSAAHEPPVETAHATEPGPEVWLRTVTQGLVGVEPEAAELHRFLAHPSEAAARDVVDRLLGDPRYGFHWSTWWADWVEGDSLSSSAANRPWHRWVAEAWNDDLSYAEFSRRQLAGDLLGVHGAAAATGWHIPRWPDVESPDGHSLPARERLAAAMRVWLGDPALDEAELTALERFFHGDLAQRREAYDGAEAEQVADTTAWNRLEDEWSRRFPLMDDFLWRPMHDVSAEGDGGSEPVVEEDGSTVTVNGRRPNKTTYVVEGTVDGAVSALKVQTLRRPDGNGPGRTSHGNFVLTEVRVERFVSDAWQPVGLASDLASSDISQPYYNAARACDQRADTGWAIDDRRRPLPDAALTLPLQKAVHLKEAERWRVTLEQHFGMDHVIGRFRLDVGEPLEGFDPLLDLERVRACHEAFGRWRDERGARAVPWTVVPPSSVKPSPRLRATTSGAEVRGRGPVELELVFPAALSTVQACRIEMTPDDGPVSIDQLTLVAVREGKEYEVHIERAFASRGDAAVLFDDDPDVGWRSEGAEPAVLVLDPEWSIAMAVGGALILRMELSQPPRSLSVGWTSKVVRGTPLFTTVEAENQLAGVTFDDTVEAALFRAFLLDTSALAEVRKGADVPPAWRPAPWTWSMRADGNPTATDAPQTPGTLHPFDDSWPRDRRGLAQWFTDAASPADRVLVERLWATWSDEPLDAESRDALVRVFRDAGHSLKALQRAVLDAAHPPHEGP